MSMIGTKGSFTRVIAATDTAAAVGSGTIDVCATPVIAAAMEAAAVAALAPHLNDDETTVGTRISLTHTAPSLVGMTLTTCAEITAHTGRQYEFTVTVRDEIGVVAEGTHTRVLVNTSRFLANADARTRK
ncbi:MAG: hotdog domain-containing protein [Negativicoccus succinicivorans]|nr:hotdog domain-containing protein [Negativicoccus succinicivorans]